MPIEETTVDLEQIGSFFSDLFGLSVSATESSPEGWGPPESVASYETAEGELRAIIACDLEASAILGAALTQIPMGAVEDALESGTLPSNLQENLGEVLNIAVNLFADARHRLVMREISFGNDSDVGEISNAPVLQLDLQRYGKCKLRLGARE